MVYLLRSHLRHQLHFEVDSTESVWYIRVANAINSGYNFEVDSTESVWYKWKNALMMKTVF